MQQCRSPDPTAPHYPHPTLPDPRGPGRAAPDPAARPAARAATLAHTVGADLKTVQDQLGHASIAITADLYTNILPATQHQAAEATARLLRHAAAGRRERTGRKQRRG